MNLRGSSNEGALIRMLLSIWKFGRQRSFTLSSGIFLFKGLGEISTLYVQRTIPIIQVVSMFPRNTETGRNLVEGPMFRSLSSFQAHAFLALQLAWVPQPPLTPSKDSCAFAPYYSYGDTGFANSWSRHLKNVLLYILFFLNIDPPPPSPVTDIGGVPKYCSHSKI